MALFSSKGVVKPLSRRYQKAPFIKFSLFAIFGWLTTRIHFPRYFVAQVVLSAPT